VEFDHAHHFLHHPEGGGAIAHVLVVYVYIILHLLAGEVGEARAVQGTHRVDAAHIIGEIEELAWLLDVHPITRAVLIEIFGFELRYCHAQMFGNAPQVFGRVGGAHGLAAVGATEAVGLVPYLLVNLYGPIVQGPGRLIAQPGEEGPHLSFVESDLLAERSQVDGLHRSE